MVLEVAPLAGHDTAAATDGQPTEGIESVSLAAAGSFEPGMHVLVVEDDPASARLLEAILTTGGHRVTKAANAAEAQELAMADPPDMVVSDVCMPGHDGIELTRWLRGQRQTAGVPILLLTALGETKTLARGLEAGADDFLFKPINSRELRARLRCVLHNRQMGDEMRIRTQAAERFVHPLNKQADLPRPQDRSAVTGPPNNGQRCDRVLIVCNRVPERTLLQVFVSELPCRIQIADDGQSALAAIGRQVPDLIVLDSVLPDMDAYELVRRAKQNPKLAHIPILVVSDKPEVGHRVRALEAGADDFILRNFDRTEFQARLRRLLRMKRSFDHLQQRCSQALREAMTDSLTGVATHGFLKELMQNEVSCGRRHGRIFSILFVDLDNFKQVNDRFGHAVGDRVLATVAQAIRGAVRMCDTVARYGGDEFVVLLPHTDQAGANTLAERLRRDIEKLAINVPGANDGQPLHVTVSLGVACFPQDATDAEGLLLHADMAMYMAKKEGRNRAKSPAASQPQSECPPVLLVDSDQDSLTTLDSYLRPEGYLILKAGDGPTTLKLAEREKPDLIIMNTDIAGSAGYDLCRRLKRSSPMNLIPVVLLINTDGHDEKLRAIEAGADVVLVRPVDKEELVARARALLRSKRATDSLESADAVVLMLARAVEAREPSAAGHVERVSHYAVELGRAAGLPECKIEGLRRAGIVHDIGKIAVPDSILLKPGKLTDGERQIMERHAETSYELLRPLRTFAEALPAVRFHHERRDGSGYPLGLRGDQIPLVAQILAIADVYDALTMDRAYREGMSRQEAIRVLRSEAERGLHHPDLVEKFIPIVGGQRSKG